jgi:hypothetical protein
MGDRKERKKCKSQENFSADPFKDTRCPEAFQPQHKHSLAVAVKELEFQVDDRLVFEEFYELGVIHINPEATKIAVFTERLHKAGIIEELIERI